MKVFVGKRESDILTYNIFDYSITFYGSNKNNNYSFCKGKRTNSNYNDDFINFTIDKLTKLKKEFKTFEIHFYNNKMAYYIMKNTSNFNDMMVNVNSLDTLNLLSHKTLSRLWLNNVATTPAFTALSRSQCTFANLKRKFGNYEQFVIQENFSGGGEGTFIINQNNDIQTINKLKDNVLYLVSPFYPNSVSYSCNVMISKDNISVFPVLKQLLTNDKSNLSYCGNEIVAQKMSFISTIKKQAHDICQELRDIGYLGVCGFDFIVFEERVMFIEINPRYQGSTFLVNKALFDNNLPSIFELNTMCFKNTFTKDLSQKCQEMSIQYKNEYYFYHSSNDIEKIKEIIKDKRKICFDDGCLLNNEYEPNVYLGRSLSNV